jgi:indolepyruvate ferredoxin oxidoreductase
VESAASFDLPDPYPTFVSPAEFIPAHGLNWDPTIQWPAQRTEYERRMIEERIPAAIGWAVANRIDTPIFASKARRLCIVTVGKAHQDLLQALENLGIGEDEAEALGLSIYKVAMSWPLATEPLLAFARDVEEIFVVEEKAPTVENQIKAALFNRPGKRIRVTGKTDAEGKSLFPIVMEFTPLMVAQALVGRITIDPIGIAARLEVLQTRSGAGEVIPFPARKPFFCSGCPHNSSTKTPEGSRSGGGIGCHVMALSVPSLKTTTFSQMGGEGLQWVGAAPFSTTEHVFQNLGDGTYQHSGLLAIRAAVASKANITFKILYNDAVAMTGGQPAEGVIDPARITRQLAAEGVRAIRVVSDDPTKWTIAEGVADGVQVHHRDALDAVQRELRIIPGVTAILYEQTCAAEKRRRRKRGEFPDPNRRLFINPRVCEGCGDCSVQSNCISVEQLPTPYGTKRRINQSSCNKDFSCVKGFCPSFVEIEGGALRKPDGDRLKVIEAEQFPLLPLPAFAPLAGVYNIYIAGIGGLGVLTVGALIGTAAYLDGKVSTVLDFTGLAQKNGAVVSQVRLAPSGQSIHAVRIGVGEIDLLLGTDSVVAANAETQIKLSPGRSAMVLNIDETPTADIVFDRDATLPTARIVETLMGRTGGRGLLLRATSIAEGLFGNNVAANTLLLGYAWQKGLVPLSVDAIRGAIKANGAAVTLNLRAFDWGRFAAVDLAEVERIAGLGLDLEEPETLDALVQRRFEDLVSYQDAAYASRYRAVVDQVRQAAQQHGAPGDAFVEAVARNAYKLMAYKDEYEVARLYADPAFRAALGAQFSDAKRLSVYLAPPLLSHIDPRTGRPAKRKFGPWVFRAFSLLARMKWLRGSWADPFGYMQERRAERALADNYLELALELAKELTPERLEIAIELARYPNAIRGYGPVKEAAMAEAEKRKQQLLARFQAPRTAVPAAA